MEKASIKVLLKRKEEQAGGTDKLKERGKKRNRLKLVIAMLVPATVVIVVALQRRRAVRIATAEANAVSAATVETKDIVSELSSSGTLLAKDSYSITALAGGGVISADFEEGGQVEKGQVLYEIDRTSMKSQLSNARNSLGRSQKNCEKAAQEYNETLSDYSGNTYKATETSYISELDINASSKASNNITITKLYSDDVVKIRIPFLSEEAVLITPGVGVVLTLTDTGEQVTGTMTAVTNQEVALTGGRMMHNVTIQATNPGGLTTSTGATAQISELVGSEDSTFIVTMDTTTNAELSATAEVVSPLVGEGDYVTVGTPIFLMITKTAEDLIEAYLDAMENAEEKMESIQSSLDDTQDIYNDYTITAPISGRVIAKGCRVGDNISRNTSSTTTAATIYNPSGSIFEVSIGELDILNVRVGQRVTVTADAPGEETYTDTAINVSLENIYSDGVTTYSIMTTMDEMGDLPPGMNVDGVITLDETIGVLATPSDALMRDNQAYVKDNTTTQQAGPVPAGFRAVEVETGLVSDSYVEIKSGSLEGDVIYVVETSTSNTSIFMMDMRGGPDGGGGQGNRGGQGGPDDGDGQGGGSR